MRRSCGISAVAAAVGLLGMSFQAGAMAPVISEWPSPVIGNEGIASPPNAFVYPDAINLDTYVTDDVTTDGAIIWSYENAGGRYSINGVDPIDAGNPNSPGTSRLDTQDLDTGQVDNNPRTITLRDTVLSPAAGPNVDPGTTGIVANGIVTLFASDGTTYSSREMFIYTDNGGVDRLSPDVVILESIDFLTAAPTTDWVTQTSLAVTGTATYSNLAGAGNGLCIQVALTPSIVFANWISPYGFIDVTPNTVFRIRATVNAAAASIESPVWSLVIDNFATDLSVIENKFGQENIFVDNLGGGSPGANSAAGTDTSFESWFTPLPVLASDWNDLSTGMFTAGKDAVNDVRVAFRVLDVDAVGGDIEGGRICLESIEVAAFDISSLSAGSTSAYDAQNITQAAGLAPSVTGTHSVTTIFGGSTNAVFAGGNVTVSPQGTQWNTVEIVTINPGNITIDTLGNTPETPDNYPIVDETDGLYQIKVGAQAPNATGETNPVDVVRVGMDDATNEVLMTSNVANTTNALGMPKTASETVYTAFYNSHNLTAATVANTNRIRPRLDVILVNSVGQPTPGINLGGVTITFMSVDKLSAP